MRAIWTGWLAMLLWTLPSPLRADDWPQYAGGPARLAVAPGPGPGSLATPRFVAGPTVSFVGRSSPVVMNRTVFACTQTRIDSTTHAGLIAFRETDGTVLWQTPLGPMQFDSWASPCCDPDADAVLLGVGYKVWCLNARTGTVRWDQDTTGPIVNASVCSGGGRVFITDYDRFGIGTKLYALAIDDGRILWTAPVPSCGGLSPAYEGGRVFVGSNEFNVGTAVLAFDAETGKRLWGQPLDWWGGLFGGVCCAGGYVYAASYDFWGPGNIVKLNANTGGVAWEQACERTDSVPVVAAGKVFVSGGIQGFGSTPKLQAFNDANGAWLWETTAVGGWTHQPAVAGTLLYAGLIPDSADGFDAYSQLHALDITKQPGQPGFVVSTNAAAGSSPAIAHGNVYSIGRAGLYAFGPPVTGPDGDVNGDGCVNVTDLVLVRVNLGNQGSRIDPPGADCHPPGAPDGIVNVSDLVLVRTSLGDGCR